MKRLSLALLLLVLAAWPAHTQPVTVIGPITPGDCTSFFSTTQLTDAGFACPGGTSGFITGGGTANYVPVFTGTTTLGNGVYLLPNGAQLYASPSGSDSGNTCSNSGAPCTLKGACLMRSGLATFLQAINGSLTINLANGTYSATDGNGALCSIEGNSGGSSSILTTLVGNVGSPSSVVLAVPNSATGVFTKDLGETEINGITITGGNGSIGVSGGQYSVVDDLGISFGSWGTSGIHFNFSGNSTLNISGYTLNNNIATGINIDSARVTASAGSVNIPSGIVFSNAFMNSNGNAQINWNAGAVTGAGVAGTTGRRAFLIGPGWMATGGTGCNTVFPGSVVCSIRLGFMDDAVDLQTTGEMLNSAMPAPTRAGDIVYNSGSSWWQSLAGNNSGTRVFFEDNGGNPGWLADSTTVDGQNCALASSCQTAIAAQSDYVATTWTPAITTDATPGTPAYTTQTGTYEQLGRQITARFNITLSGWTGSPTGNVEISGLPVADAGNYGTCVLSFYSGVNLTGAVNGITGLISDTSSTIVLYQSGSTASTKVVALTNIGTTATLVGLCNYHK
jgi:hypothetical protein